MFQLDERKPDSSLPPSLSLSLLGMRHYIGFAKKYVSTR